MNLKQMLVFLMFLVSIVKGAVIQNERNRTKRTLHYFLDGIYSALNQERRLAAARVSNEQKSSSPLSILSKLSSFSTRPKSFNALEDDTEEDTNSLLLLGNANQKTFSQMQLPIPTMKPVNVMKIDISSNQSTTQLSLLTSTTTRTALTSTTTPTSSTIVSAQSMSQESVEKSNEINASLDGTTSNPSELNTIESNEYETTIFEDSSTTMEPAVGTASDHTEITTDNDLEIVAKNSNIDNTQPPKRPLYSEIHPFSMSNRHTTQSFGSPLIVERHQNEEHSPMYLDNCGEINCLDDAENSREIRPYIVPKHFHQHNALLIIPIPYAFQSTTMRRLHNNNNNNNNRSNPKGLHINPYYMWSQNGQPIMHIHQPFIQVYDGNN